MHSAGGAFDLGGDEQPLVPRRPLIDEARFDITAMIDLVFMMNIFFLVTTVTAALAEIDLPVARHCVPADRDESVIFTILADGDRSPGRLYLGDGEVGRPVVDADAQERAVREAVEKAAREQKHTVLIKAEKSVRMRDISRIGIVATSIPGFELKLAVIEME